MAKRKRTNTTFSKNPKPNPWFAASLENVTQEEFGLRGQGRATHIGSKPITQGLKQKLITVGVSIPTLAQYKGTKATGYSAKGKGKFNTFRV